MTELSPAEAKVVETASEKRRGEFATARALARHGLRELGIVGHDLLNGSDRAPIWPDGVTGSVSHCDTRALVAVADRRVGTVGVDIEHREGFRTALWSRVFLPEEISALERHPSAERPRLALAVFCLKEALYKAQYPRSERYMGFHELSVELIDASSVGGGARCVFQGPVGPFAKGFEAEGRFVRLASGETAAGVRIP